MKVKIIKSQSDLIQGKINEFLENISSDPNVKVTVKDIKLYYNENQSTCNALVMYEIYAINSVTDHIRGISQSLKEKGNPLIGN